VAYSRSYDTATIPSAGTTSPAMTVPPNSVLVGMQMPSAFTGSAITFEQSSDAGTTWQAVYNGGSSYSITIATSKYHALDPNVFAGIRLLRIVSGSSEAADRDVVLAYSS
jgi:hypothetical protein